MKSAIVFIAPTRVAIERNRVGMKRRRSRRVRWRVGLWALGVVDGGGMVGGSCIVGRTKDNMMCG